MDLLLGCLNILLLSIIQITTSISKLNKKIQFHLESSKAQILDNFKKGNKIWDSKLHSSNSYHTNSRVKSIWPVEMLGFQRSLANFRKIVIYNFGPTTGTETTFREITFLRYRENFDPVLSQTFRLFCRRDPWDTRKKKKGDGKKIKKNPGERCFVKSYSRSWRAFVRRFMHPVSRRQFQANVPPFCCAMHSPDLFLRLSSIRKHLLFRRAMFKRVL